MRQIIQIGFSVSAKGQEIAYLIDNLAISMI
jgi:hypothetical protein